MINIYKCKGTSIPRYARVGRIKLYGGPDWAAGLEFDIGGVE